MRALGWVMLVIFCGGLFAFTAYQAGALVAVCIFLGSFLAAAFLVVAINLIFRDGGKKDGHA